MRAAVLTLVTLATVLAFGCGKSEKPSQARTDNSPESPIETTMQEGTPQTLCPVMGNPINRNLYVDCGGKRIYVCCRACIEQIKKDPQKYIDEMEAAGVTLERVPQ